MSTDFAELHKKKEQARKSLLKANPYLDNKSGIYFLIRKDIDTKYIYIGKSVTLMDRMISHMIGYSQRIDLSLKKRGFYSADNPTGWELNFLHFPKNELDKWERHYIEQYQSAGFTLYNVESGGTEGKTIINERKPPKTYREGVAQGYKNAQRDVAKLFEKNLTYGINGEPNKNKEKALAKFEEFLNIKKDEE